MASFCTSMKFVQSDFLSDNEHLSQRQHSHFLHKGKTELTFLEVLSLSRAQTSTSCKFRFPPHVVRKHAAYKNIDMVHTSIVLLFNLMAIS